MNYKTLCSLLCICVMALTYYIYRQSVVIESLQAELDQRIATRPEQSSHQASIEETPTSLASTAETDSPQILDTEAETEHLSEQERDSDRVMRSFSRMMENPTMNEMMQASQRGALSVLYKDLMEKLGLTADEKEHFLDLLMARQMMRVETSMKMMGGGISKEERKTLQAEAKEYDEIVKEEIDVFLNDEADSEVFSYYEKSMQERMAISGFEAKFASTGEPLSEGVSENLIRIMSEERENHNFQSSLYQTDNYDFSPERFNDQEIDKLAQDLASLNEKIADRVEAVLTDPQFDAFVANQFESTELQISQIRMAAKMFQGQSPKP